MNLDDFLRNEFSKTGTLCVYDTFSTNKQFNICGKPRNTVNDVAIVIQGGIADQFTLNLIELAIYRYKLSYPNCIIVVSTWNNIDISSINTLTEKTRIYSNVFLLLNKPPEYAGSANGNMQIVSTLNGAKFAKRQGAQYVLKTRTDQLFGDFLFLDQLITLHNTFKEKLPESQQGRIIVGSMGTFQARPFCVSDFFSFGFVDDIISMWDLELDTLNQRSRDIFIRDRSPDDKRPMANTDVDHFNYVTGESRCGEGYFTSNVLYNSGRCYSYDWKDSENFLASCFIVADSCSLGLIWPKYGMTSSFGKYKSGHAWGTTFEKSTHGMYEINFTKWLEFYVEYLKTAEA
tara:strand:- start:2676 stop:3713 length:1038 start_codon:yes stop_codon:yes gene_type:complete